MPKKLTKARICLIIAAIGKVVSQRQLHNIVYLLGYGDDFRLCGAGLRSQTLNNFLHDLVDSLVLVESHENYCYRCELSDYGKKCLALYVTETVDADIVKCLAAHPVDVLDQAAQLHYADNPLILDAVRLLKHLELIHESE